MPKTDTYDYEWFGSAFRELREERGLSRGDLVAAIASRHPTGATMSTDYVRKLEKGARKPSMRMLGQMLGVLDITRDELERRGAAHAGEPWTSALNAPSATAGDARRLDGAGESWSAAVGGPHAMYSALAASSAPAPEGDERPPAFGTALRRMARAPRVAPPSAELRSEAQVYSGLVAQLVLGFAELSPDQRLHLLGQLRALRAS